MTDHRHTFFLTGAPNRQAFLHHRARDLESLTGWRCNARWLGIPENAAAHEQNPRRDLQDALTADVVILWVEDNTDTIIEPSPEPYLLAGAAIAHSIPLLWTGSAPPSACRLTRLPIIRHCRTLNTAAAHLNNLAPPSNAAV